jgi:O-antigen ligase
MNAPHQSKITVLDRMMQISVYSLGFFGFYVALFVAVIIYMPSRLATVPQRGIMLGAALLTGFYILARGRRFYSGGALVWLIIFWLAMLARIYFGQFSGEIRMHPTSYYLIYSIGVCGLPMIPFLAQCDYRRMMIGFWSLMFTGVLGANIALALYGFGGVGRAKGGEFVGDFVAIGPLHVAYMGSALFCLGLYTAFYSENFKSLDLKSPVKGIFWTGIFYFFLPERWRFIVPKTSISLLLLATGAYLVMFGASRGPIIAIAACGIFIALAKTRKPEHIFRLFFILLVVGVGGFGLIYLSQFMGSNLYYRVMGIFDLVDIIKYGGFGGERYFMWKEAIAQFMSSPLIGSGLVLEGYYSYPHNGFIEAFMATGILGGSAFCIFVFICLKKAFDLIRYEPRYGWASILFVHYLMYLQFSSSLITNNYFWYASAMVLGFSESVNLKMLKRGYNPGAQHRRF